MNQQATIFVPFAKLIPSEAINARDADDYTDGIPELAAMIKTQGLLQPLVVRNKGAKFEICAGKRRYTAIGELIKAGEWPKDQGVECKVREMDDAEALETSLIENIGRRDMHPVAEYEVFAKLHGQGSTPEAIAQRYGITATEVRQRLALGGLHPDIRKAWRAERLDGDAAQAFAACLDKTQQIKAFNALKRQGGSFWAQSVRQYFVKDRPRLNDPRVAFVGLQAYRDAGGNVHEDLFGGDGYLEDTKLFDKLVAQKLAAKCEELIAEGWSWASPVEDLGTAHYSWGTLQPRRKYTPEERERLKAIDVEIKKLEAHDEHSDREDELTEERNRIEKAAEARGFSAEQKAQAGCVVECSRNAVRITYGKVKNVSPTKLAQRQEKAKAKVEAVEAGEEVPAEEQHISNALHVDITEAQTHALIAAVAQVPAVAIRLAAAALAPGRHDWRSASPVRLQPDGLTRYAHMGEERVAHDEEEDDETPASGFGAAFAAIKPEKAAQVLAVNIGRAIDVRAIKYKAPNQAEIDAIVAALPGNIYLPAMRERFKAEDYFARASAKIALAALEEMETEGVDRKAKKPALATQAAADAIAKGWLPPECRHPDYALTGKKRAKVRA